MDEIKAVLVEILRIGLLRIRAFGNAGDAEQCAREGDHLHNLPELLRSTRLELLDYYLNVEKQAFLSQGTKGVDQYAPLWDRLARLIEAERRKGQR